MFDRLLLLFISSMTCLILWNVIETKIYVRDLHKEQFKQTELDLWFENHSSYIPDTESLPPSFDHLPDGLIGE